MTTRICETGRVNARKLCFTNAVNAALWTPGAIPTDHQWHHALRATYKDTLYSAPVLVPATSVNSAGSTTTDVTAAGNTRLHRSVPDASSHI
jgi:hypothetical protein